MKKRDVTTVLVLELFEADGGSLTLREFQALLNADPSFKPVALDHAAQALRRANQKSHLRRVKDEDGTKLRPFRYELTKSGLSRLNYLKGIEA